jgi:hypothetical protein
MSRGDSPAAVFDGIFSETLVHKSDARTFVEVSISIEIQPSPAGHARLEPVIRME